MKLLPQSRKEWVRGILYAAIGMLFASILMGYGVSRNNSYAIAVLVVIAVAVIEAIADLHEWMRRGGRD